MQSAKEKLQTLYQIYEKPMYHIAYAILHHPQQAEDAVSEAFCRVIRHLDKIGEPEHPKTKQYMIKIIRSTAISQYRKNARESSRYAPWDDGDRPAVRHERSCRAETIRTCQKGHDEAERSHFL